VNSKPKFGEIRRPNSTSRDRSKETDPPYSRKRRNKQDSSFGVEVITKMVGFFERRTSSNFLAFSLANYTDRVIWSSSNAQSASNDHHIWFRGQFWSPTMKDSRRRVIFNAIARDWRHRCDSKRPGVSSFRTVSHQTNYLIQRAILKSNYEGFPTPCYFQCYCTRLTTSLWFQKTQCNKLSNRVT
jgi:hypothetical protein